MDVLRFVAKSQLRPRWISLALVVCVHFGAILWIGGQWEDYRAHAASASFKVVEVQLRPLASSLQTALQSDRNLGADSPAAVDRSTTGASQGTTEIAHPTDELRSSASTLYYASAELDQSPTPLDPLLIPFPEGVLGQGKVEGVLLLYIGSNGKVERIETVQSTSFPSLDHAAKEAFMQAVMHPGIKGGKAVGAKMKVVVEFEAR